MMRHRLIDWVDSRCRLWGLARRHLDLKLESWPESVWARIRDGIPPESFAERNFPEVFTGDALLVRRAIPALTDRQRAHIYVHYVVPVPTKEKILRLGHSRENYYQMLAASHRRLANMMDYTLTKSA